MMALALNQNEQALARLYDGPQTQMRVDRTALFAGGVVCAAFAALGLYFAGQSFTPVFPNTGPAAPVVINIPTYTPPVVEPEPRPVEEVKPVETPPPTFVRETVAIPVTPVDPIPAQSTSDTVPLDRPIGPLASLGETPTRTPEVITPSAPPPLVTAPNWLRRPSGADVDRHYPSRAQRLGVSGSAILNCIVTVSGELSNCRVTAEDPAGMGFGRAALDMAPLFQMTPQTRDGRPVGGAKVNVPLNFRLR